MYSIYFQQLDSLNYNLHTCLGHVAERQMKNWHFSVKLAETHGVFEKSSSELINRKWKYN